MEECIACLVSSDLIFPMTQSQLGQETSPVQEKIFSPSEQTRCNTTSGVVVIVTEIQAEWAAAPVTQLVTSMRMKLVDVDTHCWHPDTTEIPHRETGDVGRQEAESPLEERKPGRPEHEQN